MKETLGHVGCYYLRLFGFSSVESLKVGYICQTLLTRFSVSADHGGAVLFHNLLTLPTRPVSDHYQAALQLTPPANRLLPLTRDLSFNLQGIQESMRDCRAGQGQWNCPPKPIGLESTLNRILSLHVKSLDLEKAI